MYRVLRSRQAISQSPIIHLPRQYLSDGLRALAGRRLFTCSPHLHATELHGQVGQSQDLRGDTAPSLTENEADRDNLENRSNRADKLPTRKLNIRERLRKWEEDNAAQHLVDIRVDEASAKGGIQNVEASGDNIIDPYQDNSSIDVDQSPFFETGELVDFEDARPFLLKGDLVDLNVSNSRQPELAIYVRNLEGFSQFYTMTGRWVVTDTRGIIFYVPQFVAPEEVDGLLPYLPGTVGPLSEVDRLQNFMDSLPRTIGAPLVRKLLDFWQKTQTAYRFYADRLRHAHDIMASENVLRYCTVEQVANMLLPKTVLDNGRVPPHILFAVHRTLLDDASGFRPENGAQHRYGTRYEVKPKIELSVVRRVTEWVRNFQEGQVLGGDKDSPLAQFIPKAQRLIDKSREHRELTKSGALGPFTNSSGKKNSSSAPSSRRPYEQFSDTDIDILRFLEYWVAILSFTNYSSTNAIGSRILRAMDRYGSFELDRNTGWTFLKEIGVYSPWESKAPFDLRLPNNGFQLSLKEEIWEQMEQEPSDSRLEDRMEALRKDWASMPVYCIDDLTAHEIDDGVSLEPIRDNLDEYWVHVHTADPASHIKPSSGIGKSAQQMATSVYFPESMIPMIPRNITLNQFSLANDRPCLTFSARINDSGNILETKITPGYVRNVKYTAPSVVEEIVSGRKPHDEDKGKLYIVGEPKSSESPSRDMLQKSDFTSEDEENLRKLHSLALARRQKAIENGALPPTAAKYFGRINPTVSVHLNEERSQPLTSPYLYNRDPTIEFRPGAMQQSEHEKTTTNLMLLAGEIAAIWCHDRNIPVPFRVTPRNPGSANFSRYMREVLRPALDNGGMNLEQMSKYKELLGPVKPSSVPGPHLGLGVSKFAKATSPLRRYGDLLLHWQVEAALLEEAKTGQSLVGSTRQDYLPFSKQDVDGIIPALEGRERFTNLVQMQSTRFWTALFVLRAWKYNQSTIPFPRTFNCTVLVTTNPMGILFNVDFLGATALGELPDGFKRGEVEIGDVFECEFEDVNAYFGQVQLKVLKRVDK